VGVAFSHELMSGDTQNELNCGAPIRIIKFISFLLDYHKKSLFYGHFLT